MPIHANNYCVCAHVKELLQRERQAKKEDAEREKELRRLQREEEKKSKDDERIKREEEKRIKEKEREDDRLKREEEKKVKEKEKEEEKRKRDAERQQKEAERQREEEEKQRKAERQRALLMGFFTKQSEKTHADVSVETCVFCLRLFMLVLTYFDFFFVGISQQNQIAKKGPVYAGRVEEGSASGTYPSCHRET